MASALRDMFSDPSTLPLIATAVATAAYGSYRANESLIKSEGSSSSSSVGDSSSAPPGLTDSLLDSNTHILHGRLALAFPLIAAVSITILFFFLSSLGVIFTLLSTVSAFFSLLFLFWPFAHLLLSRLVPRPKNSHLFLLSLLPTVLLLLDWLLTGHWLPNDLIGVSLCVLFASLCKVPSLRVTAILFFGLFLYDIFFVFFSERFFGANVMVEVATTAPTNPASAIATWLHLPVTPVETLALPAKLVLPTADGYAILGLGDIILPEILLVYLLHFDLRTRSSPFLLGYFFRALLAYAFALFLSFFCNYAFLSAQPALLYIVPSVLLVTCLTAWSRNHFYILWNGPPEYPPSYPDDDASDHSDLHNESYSLLEQSKTRHTPTAIQAV